MIYYIYILHCENNSYYTGYTNNIQQRFAAHCDGTSKCKYTRSFKPTHISQCWQLTGTRALAMKIERYIKSLQRDEKLTLINFPENIKNNFPLEVLEVIKLDNIS